jgi:protein-disulfide isomerase
MTNLSPTIQLQPPVHEQDHCQGRKEARLTLVEYGDYACPQCVQAHPLIQSIQAQFSDVCFVFRYFPCIDRHPSAQHAAEAAEAAAAQGKFWEMHDRLMGHGQLPDDASLIEHAIALRLDINRFLHEMSTDCHVARVLNDYDSGIRSGVNCTPTFFINGFQWTGDWQQSALQTTIEQILS